MNKAIFAFALVLLVSASFVVAQGPPNGVGKPGNGLSCEDLGYNATQQGGVGSMDDECQAHGFQFGIAKWEWNETSEQFELESEKAGYSTNVWGDADEAYWTSTPGVAGVLSKEATCYQYLPGGYEGTVEKLHYGISHLTLCGNDEPNGEVPEFGLIGGLLVVAGAAGFLVFRRK